MKKLNQAIVAARQIAAEDVYLCEQNHKADPQNQAARRNFIRAEFSFIEAGLYAMRYSVAKGDESKIPDRVPTKENMEQSFNELAKTLGINIAINKQDSGWDAMTKLIRIRNRITHPKRPRDLIVSDPDMKDFNKATAWFSETTGELLRVILNGLKLSTRRS